MRLLFGDIGRRTATTNLVRRQSRVVSEMYWNPTLIFFASVDPQGIQIDFRTMAPDTESVSTALNGIGLAGFIGAFYSEGIETVADLRLLSESNMKDLGLNMGQRNRLKKYVGQSTPSGRRGTQRFARDVAVGAGRVVAGGIAIAAAEAAECRIM